MNELRHFTTELSVLAALFWRLFLHAPLSWKLAGLVGVGFFVALFTVRRSEHNPIVRLNGLSWSRDDFCRGWLITGDTGSGKTRSGINQLLFQVFQNEPRWGGFCIDDKGIYWETLVAMARHFNRERDLVLLQVRPDNARSDWKPTQTYNLTSAPGIPFSTFAKFVVDYFDLSATRSKTNLQFNRLESRPVEAATGVRSDQIIWLRNPSSIQHYPDKLRRIHYVDAKTGKSLIFLTNNFTLPALTIALLYKARWQVELFFKWIKQHLRIKHFYGTSDNAVKTQIWISICVYTLVAIVKKQLESEKSLYSSLQILSVNAFAQEPLHQILMDSGPQILEGGTRNQLVFNY